MCVQESIVGSTTSSLLRQEQLFTMQWKNAYAPLSKLSKFPFLLPSKTPADNTYHLQHSCMFSSQSTLTALRQEFMLLTGRQVVESECTNGKKCNGKFYLSLDPAPLPENRKRNTPSFTVAGIDFTRALYIHEKQKCIYSYLCTYATRRVIHLKVVSDLTVDILLLSFRKCASQRSLPSDIR